MNIRKILNRTNHKLEFITGYRLRTALPRGSVRFAKKHFENNLIVACEIGTYDGVHAMNINKHLNIKKFHLIDSFEEDDVEGVYDVGRIEVAKRRSLMRTEGLPNVTWHIMRSEKAIKKIKEKLDYVYIDGGHTYDIVKKDIKDYWKKIKEGGILAGHDMENSSPSGIKKGVTEAVIEFAYENKLKLYVEQMDWWVVKGPKGLKKKGVNFA